MNTQFFQRSLPPYWRLSTIRCCIYAAIVGWGSFQTGVQGYESFSDMTQMQFWQFIGNIAVSMLGVWLAFLDQSLSKISSTNPPLAAPTDSK